ncbi:Tripartite ATP-independent periplasmic transporter, DctQ component [compost metagenome]
MVALALIGYSVVVRYFLGQPSLWIDEVVSFLVVAIVMFGVASALREGRHIGVDLLTERLGSRGRRMAKAWSMLTVLSLSVFLVFNGWETAAFSREIGQVSQGHLELPMFWLQLMIPFGGLMLALTAFDALLQLACGAPAEGGEH